MSVDVLAVLQHPDLDGIAVTVTESHLVHDAPMAMAVMNRVPAGYSLIGVVSLRSQKQGEELLGKLALRALPGPALHFDVDPRELRALARPRLWSRFVGGAPSCLPERPRDAGDVSKVEKRHLAFDLWAHKKVAMSRLPYTCMGVVLATLAAGLPWGISSSGFTGSDGLVWHAIASGAVGFAVFYGVAFAAARPAVEATRAAVREWGFIIR